MHCTDKNSHLISKKITFLPNFSLWVLFAINQDSRQSTMHYMLLTVSHNIHEFSLHGPLSFMLTAPFLLVFSSTPFAFFSLFLRQFEARSCSTTFILCTAMSGVITSLSYSNTTWNNFLGGKRKLNSVTCLLVKSYDEASF